ncbi:MAG TPA: aminotransferase class III-fold pyridoxal phosphate-dependent enzyme, partial [Pseudomonadales bacterium]|nr:aminotransferase class III-fold pyridoxal phosphate-dependent enzyme [Pseudomonadales bacterium]
LMQQYFVPRPSCRFGEDCTEKDIAPIEALLQKEGKNIAAVILEPIAQGAGGMWFYSAEYLRRVRELCHQYDVLFIADEIATGFGRTGKLFACEHADIAPDILCVGKALTGGYMTLAATLTTEAIARRICSGESRGLMHGPTFMANPLACRVAHASIDLLLSQPWQKEVMRIEKSLQESLSVLRGKQGIADVRVLGAIGVVELEKAVDMQKIQPMFVEKGVWIRPFGKLVYVMPPYIIDNDSLKILTQKMIRVIEEYLYD